MSHKVIKKEKIREVKEEIARLGKAIDRLRIYSNAKDNETIKSILGEIRILQGSAIRRKDAALKKYTEEGSLESRFWHGYEQCAQYFIETFENPEEEIKEYDAKRKQLEKYLTELRTKHEIRD